MLFVFYYFVLTSLLNYSIIKKYTTLGLFSMFNFLINKTISKNKTICFSGFLLFATSVISPLTSCTSDGSVNDIGGFDKEFGFDAHTYNRLENEFKNKYFNYLQHNDLDKNIALNKYHNFLQNDLTILRNKLFDPIKNYSFTIRTNSLLDYASKNYNIYLNHNANVGQTDFANLKQSCLENFLICINQIYGISSSDIDEKKVKFSTQFDNILKNANLNILIMPKF